MSPSYRTSLAAFRTFLRAVRLPWSKPQQGNLALLAAAFFHKRTLAIRPLARGLAGPAQAQQPMDKRLRRFLGNEKLCLNEALAAFLRFLLPRFGGAPFVPVMLDWTFAGTTHAILWAQIPYRGRSFPLLARVYPYHQSGSTTHELALLRDLHKAWPKASPPPLLLADRGFPKRELLDWLALNDWFFLIRGKRSHGFYDANGERFDVQTVRCGEHYLCGATVLDQWPGSLHIVIRAVRNAKTEKLEHWLLYTNLPETQLEWATRLYRHRMQPEQTHRDCKHGHFVTGFALRHLQRMRRDRLERLLFCLGFCYAFLNFLAETERETRAWLAQRHWGLSLITFGLDLLQALGTRLVPTLRNALANLRLRPLWEPDDDGKQPTAPLQPAIPPPA